MKRPLVAFMLASVIALGCSRPEVAPVPDTSHAGESPAIRASAHSTAEVITEAPDIWIWAEGDTRPPLSQLLPDPKDGVWGGQDGELFHFRVREDRTFGRVTYGRPHPAAVWLGDLVRLSDRQLAGRVITRHLVHKAPDGKATDLAPARSPAGAPFDFLDDRHGRLHLHDRQGTWYRLSDTGKEFQPVQELTSGSRTGHPGLGAAQQQALERETGGRVQAWIVPLNDGSSYALVEREQLFLFDAADAKFKLLGQPGMEPVGSLNGQIVARNAGGLVLVDTAGQKVREFPLDLKGQFVFQGVNGWFYSLPFLAVNLTTGEERHLDVPALRGGAVSALIPLAGGRMAGATAHGRAVFLFDPQTGQLQIWGRPIPELGQQAGEEMAPISGLAEGSDGYLYVAIGTGAAGKHQSHLVRMDETGRVLAKTWLPEPVHGLVMGADQRIYGSGYARVVVLPPDGKVR